MCSLRFGNSACSLPFAPQKVTVTVFARCVAASSSLRGLEERHEKVVTHAKASFLCLSLCFKMGPSQTPAREGGKGGCVGEEGKQRVLQRQKTRIQFVLYPSLCHFGEKTSSLQSGVFLMGRQW